MSTLANRKKYWTQRSGMTHAAWRAAQEKSFTHRYLHISAPIQWIKDPRTAKDKLVRPDVPIVARLGRNKLGQPLGTYNVGNNARKRIRNELRRMYSTGDLRA